MNADMQLAMFDPQYSGKSGKSRKRRRLEDGSPSKKKNKGEESDSDSDSESESEDYETLRGVIRSKIKDALIKGEDDNNKGKKNHLYFDDYINVRTARKLISQIEELSIKLGKLGC